MIVEIMLSWWMLVPFLWSFINLLGVFVTYRKYGIEDIELLIVFYFAVLPSFLMILTKQMP